MTHFTFSLSIIAQHEDNDQTNTKLLFYFPLENKDTILSSRRGAVFLCGHLYEGHSIHSETRQLQEHLKNIF